MAWRFGSLEIDRTFLESKVARRLFGVFAACALIPVLAFAVFSYRAVGKQLERDAEGALHRTSKAAGMAIFERLLLADHALRLHAGAAGAKDDAGASRVLRGIEALPADHPALLALEEKESRHLALGHALLQTGEVGGSTSVHLLRRRDPADASAGAWLGEVDLAFLFAGERHPVGGRLWVTAPGGAALHASEPGWLPPARLGEDGAGVAIDGEESLLSSWELFLASAFLAEGWSVFVTRPLAEVHRPLREFEAVFPWVAGITLFGALGLSLFHVRRTLVPIGALSEGARRMARGNFGARVEVASRDEFGALATSFNEMADEISRHVSVLSLVNQVGAALSAEHETPRLVDLILQGSMDATSAEAGALYLMGKDGRLALAKVRLGDDPVLPRHALEEAIPRGVAERCLAGRGTTRIHRAAALDDDERAIWSPLEERLGEKLSAYLTVPLRDERRENLGVLLLVRAGSGTFTGQQGALAESLASQAAVTIRKNQLVDSFRGLFEGLIELTVGAIDEKSAYTGEHCRNVPIITELIADAACDDTVGPMKDFHLSPEERYELRIAALLHDCGKVVTPVHVMDKATKLETIHDRIQLVETRFELLRRDAMIRALARRIHEAGLDLVARDDVLHADLRDLDRDLAFLQKCNLGAERMEDAARERVQSIARRYEWVDQGGRAHAALSEDEVRNLQVQRGTLNDDERGIIEYHVVATMKLLERLPFPRDLKNVPSIAGAHHERMDGSGYPLRLRGDQLSIQARILGLADVFEALTAKDRPYKPGRSLRETLDILARMGEEGHIDPKLLELFVRDKLHLRYAVDRLSPEQIDPEFQAEIEALTGP